MRKLSRMFAALLLIGALGGPVVMMGQDRDRDHDRDHDQRYYDRAHHDYHNWDTRENEAYRHWLVEERHRQYVDWNRLNRRDQDAYWRWRHDHSDWHR